jgi:hypothetical protein
LNAQTSPAAAALFYSNYFERPLASAANNPNREQSAVDVYQAAQSGNWPAGGGASSVPTGGTSTASFNPLDPSTWISSLLGTITSKFAGDIKDWLERGALIVMGFTLIIVGIHLLASGGKSQPFAINVESKEGPKGSTTTRNIKTPVGTHKTTSTRSVAKGVGANEALEAAAVA